MFGVVVMMEVWSASAAENERAVEWSDTNPPPSLRLDVLVADALEKNPELKFYEAELAAARGGRTTAGVLANPELTGSIGQKTVGGDGLSAEGVAWSVSVMQPFEWPGRLGLRKAIANHDIELAELGLARFRAALAARVRTVGYGLYAAQEKAVAAREVADRFRSLREVLIQRDPAGLTPLLETRVIEATELNMQRKASESSLGEEMALIELNQLRGEDPNNPLQVAQPELLFGALDSRETLVAMARTNSFEVRARAVELAQHGFRVDLAANERYPTVSAGPSISEERAGDRERVVGVAISLPLPLWNRNNGSMVTARARQTQARTSLYVAQRDAERQALAAARTYETKVREMTAWRPDSVLHFREAAEIADRHYRLGAVPISTYVELQKQYLEAAEALLDTRREALEAAAQLELLTGMPVPLVTTPLPEEKK